MNFIQQCRLISVIAITILFVTGCAPAPPTATPTPVPVPTATSLPNVVRFTAGEWPPYASESLPHGGFHLHLITEALAAEGFEVEYDFYPRSRAWYLVENGSYEASAVWVKLPKREEIVLYPPTSVGAVCEVFFHRVNYPFDWKTADDLVGHQIGVIVEYDSTVEFEMLQQEGKPLTLDVSTSELSNFKKLLLERIDLFPCAKEVGLRILREELTPEEAARITYHPQPWRFHALHPVFSRQSPRAEVLIQAYERGLQHLKDTGRYAQILQDYMAGAYTAP